MTKALVPIVEAPWARRATALNLGLYPETGHCEARPDSDYRGMSIEGYYEIFTPDYEAARAINLYGALYSKISNRIAKQLFKKIVKERGTIEGFSFKKLWRKVKKAARKVTPKFVRKAVKKVTNWKPVKFVRRKAGQFIKWIDKATKHPAFSATVFAITQLVPGAQGMGYAFLALQAARGLLAKMSSEGGINAQEFAEGMGQLGTLTNKASGGDMFAQATLKAYQEAERLGVKPKDIDKMLAKFPDKGKAIKAAGGAVAASIAKGNTNPGKLLSTGAKAAGSSAFSSAKKAFGDRLSREAQKRINQAKRRGERAYGAVKSAIPKGVPSDLAHLFA